MLDDGLGDDPPPRVVPQTTLANLALVDGHRRLGRTGGDLVRDGQDPVEPVLSSDVHVARDLLIAKRSLAGLHLHETGPGPASALARDRAVRNHRLAGRILEA